MSIEDKDALISRAEKALDTIRPHLQVDGGNVEIVDISEDFILEVRWLGNCEMCSMSAMTMKAGIEQTIKQQVPELQGVKALNGLTQPI